MAPSAESPPSRLPDFESLPKRYGWPTANEKGYQLMEQLAGTERPLRVVHIGAGASGICLAKFLPERLNNVSFTCYDKNADIGGTWLENRYPGCACDIPSVNYQFTWARNPNWSKFYSEAHEIWQYFKDIVDRFGLARHFKLSHEVIGAYWKEDTGVWEVQVKDLNNGKVFVDKAEILINGSGVLNHWEWPRIEGLLDFKGVKCHTANYPEGLDLSGKRVAVIGIGSSGVQVIPKIAPQVSKLYTWVRSPTWITAGFAQKFAGPNGQNFEYSTEQKERWADDHEEYLQYCKEVENELNQRFKFILQGTPEAAAAQDFSTKEMRKKLGERRDIMQKLIPSTFQLGCRRPTPGNGFLEALTLPHVTTFTEQIERITETGFIDHEGKTHEVDVIICATGFNTSWVPRFPIVARGINIQDHYRDNPPISYISSGVPKIPNYFTSFGPYGPHGHGSFLPIVERLLHNCLTMVQKVQVENIKSFAPKPEACEAFIEQAQLFLKRTAFSGDCPSWFKQGRRDGPLSIFPGSRLTFFRLHAAPRYEDFDYTYVNGNRFGWLGNGFSVEEYDASDLSYYLGTRESPGALLPAHPPPLPHGQVIGAEEGE
ncbi:hypothetical protein FE257_007852 [Aspergillus nanangensis]|uniref:Uncharacterized protein n=1 Tax=Aspergillus nanangensis TaxID=2582783 RepID=A0AAD4CX56_ASPNN|nr:hypothetical protein FE257_007852 [Aspergillus nanangensis]